MIHSPWQVFFWILFTKLSVITKGPLEDGGDANHRGHEVGQEYFVRVEHGAYPGPPQDGRVERVEENRVIWRASPEKNPLWVFRETERLDWNYIMILLYKAPCHQSGTLHKNSKGNHIQLPDAEDDFLRHNAPDQRAEGPDKNHETCGVGSSFTRRYQ